MHNFWESRMFPFISGRGELLEDSPREELFASTIVLPCQENSASLPNFQASQGELERALQVWACGNLPWRSSPTLWLFPSSPGNSWRPRRVRALLWPVWMGRESSAPGNVKHSGPWWIPSACFKLQNSRLPSTMSKVGTDALRRRQEEAGEVNFAGRGWLGLVNDEDKWWIFHPVQKWVGQTQARQSPNFHIQ